MLVEEIMIRDVSVVKADTSVFDALTLAEKMRVRHLPVVEENEVIGIISDRDLRDVKPSVLCSEKLDILTSTYVKDIMHAQVVTVHPLDAIEDAARMIYEHRVGCLPVVQKGKLVGIVTTSDLLHALVDLMGMGQPGSHLEIELPNQPGALLDITRIIKDNGINIISIYINPDKNMEKRVVSLRIATFDPRRIIEQIKSAGYPVLFPMSLGGD
ncbi:CBS domain-containing protein [Heliobacterium chlorum]|uniref:CBS domain-containing protein n=1 Tax=Heliobacterium chlorum TaxID=2698 RepID=A0ABR7T716_HELCL|nr:CBS and ACT domain-containing protein [Heliobacterium chlorum]MBC9785755.1 CBS domain-containing protein [Heliobacterium chlorum]